MAYKNQIISILILPKPSSPMMTPSENQISFIIDFSHLSNIMDRFRKGFKPLEQGNLVKLSSLIVGEGRTLTPIFDENCIRLNSNFVAIERDEASYIALWEPIDKRNNRAIWAHSNKRVAKRRHKKVTLNPSN